MVMVAIKSLFFIFVILLIVFAAIGIYLHWSFVSLLREKYPDKWNELGRPTLIINNSIKNDVAVLSFLKNKGYLSLNDKQLNKIAMLLWNFGYIYIVIFTITIFLFIIRK